MAFSASNTMYHRDENRDENNSLDKLDTSRKGIGVTVFLCLY